MNRNDLWCEKYRPSSLDELVISEETKQIITNFGENIPNLLFCGVQGSGKTSLARILVQDILKCDYLYVNASDETGVDNIRNKVSGFAQTKSLDGNLKVIILDEADYLSSSSQAALRNLIESYSNTTRFILTGNYRHKIIPALQSRCQSIDVKPNLKGAVKKCLQILNKEKISYDKGQLTTVVNLVKKHNPDLRRCINELQKYCINGELKISTETDVSQVIHIIWDNLLNKKSLLTRKYLIENDHIFNSDWDKLLIDLLNYIYDENIDEANKKLMLITIADHIEKSSRVIDKEINFFACLLNLEQI